MYYLKEEERGFYPKEDLIVPGRYEISILPRETKEITFVASLEDNTEQIDSNKVFKSEIERVNKIIISKNNCIFNSSIYLIAITCFNRIVITYITRKRHNTF